VELTCFRRCSLGRQE